MNTRFYNARILTVCDYNITDGEVWVEGNRISYAGKARCPEFQFDREIDLGRNIIMPSFKNAHTHTAMTFLRSFADDLPLDRWLNEAIFPMEKRLTADDVYTLTKLGIMEYLTSGISACFDMYLHCDEVALASTECGFRTVLCGSVNDFSDSAEELERQYLKFNSYNELISMQLGFHAEYTTSLELMKNISAIAHKYKAPVFTHLAETENEVQGCIDRYGKTPCELLDAIGMFDFGGGGFHCVHMSENDIDIFKKRGLFAITNPASNCKLASGIAPLVRMNENGIKLGIGTDGPASNNCLDMFREMFLCTALQKLSLNDASAMKACDVLKMATSGSALAMGLDDCDDIKEGKIADLIVIDLKQPNMQPLNNIANNIVYSGSKQNVVITMVNGRILYENGKFDIGVCAEKIYEKANEIAERIRHE